MSDEARLRVALASQAMDAPSSIVPSSSVVRRARRARARFVAGCLVTVACAATMAVAGAAVLSPDEDAVRPIHVQPSESRCPQVPEGGYTMTIDPASASTGARVIANGPIPMYDEQGLYRPPVEGDTIAFWLDADPRGWADLVEGRPGETPSMVPVESPGNSATYLGSTNLATAAGCDFRFRFEMPRTSAGSHSIVAVEIAGDSAALYDSGRIEARASDRSSELLCPHLVRPGSHARRALAGAVDEYLAKRKPKGARDFEYSVKRLTRRIRGGPEQACPLATWRRSFDVSGSFHYKKSVPDPSASLAFFHVVVGRTASGWIVWADLH